MHVLPPLDLRESRSCRELIDSTRKIRHGRPFAKRVARSLEESLSVSADDLIIKSQQYKGYEKCEQMQTHFPWRIHGQSL